MSTNTFQLSEPAVFTELNKKEERDPQYVRDSITLSSLKYKHFRAIAPCF